MNYMPLGVAAAVGLGDGLIENEVKSVKYAKLGWDVGAVALGFYFDRTRRHDPNMNYALMTSGVALIFSRVPRAFQHGLATAFGDVDELRSSARVHRPDVGDGGGGLTAPRRTRLGPGGGGGSYLLAEPDIAFSDSSLGVGTGMYSGVNNDPYNSQGAQQAGSAGYAARGGRGQRPGSVALAEPDSQDAGAAGMYSAVNDDQYNSQGGQQAGSAGYASRGGRGQRPGSVA
jgi:hypothetical protein